VEILLVLKCNTYTVFKCKIRIDLTLRDLEVLLKKPTKIWSSKTLAADFLVEEFQAYNSRVISYII
jgi:hypothetical protein